MSQGSCCSQAKLARNTCGNLKLRATVAILGFTGTALSPGAFAASSALFLYVSNEGASAPLEFARIDTPFCSIPVLAQAFSIQTKGARPLKMPSPPRSIVLWVSSVYQRKPKRGENISTDLGLRPTTASCFVEKSLALKSLFVDGLFT